MRYKFAIHTATLFLLSISPVLAQSPPPMLTQAASELSGPAEKVSQLPESAKRPIVAIALGGGGARCAAHIGVLRALEKAGIEVDYVVGCSMGALIGSLYCGGVSLDKIEELMVAKDGVFRAFLPTPLALRLIGHGPAFAAHALKIPKEFGLYSGENLAKYIDANLPLNKRQIENLNIHFAAVSTDLVDGQTLVIAKGDVGKAVQASCALPGLFRASKTYSGKLLVDGGLRANVPARAARATGADIVIAVNVDEKLQVESPEKFKQTSQLTNRLVAILLEEIDEHQLENADIQIRPETSGISIYSRKYSDMRASIEAGEMAASASIAKIKEKLAGIANKQ